MKIASLSALLVFFSAGAVALAQSVPVPGKVPTSGQAKAPRPVQMAVITPRPAPPVFRLSTNLPAATEILNALQRKGSQIWKAPLKPGVYKTAPYTCLVLVPGSGLDEKSIIKPPVPDPPMLKLEPDLDFIPYSPKPSK